MSNRASSKSSLFLMELILLILFFSVAAAICVRLFVTAHLDSLESAALNRAVLMAQSAAEVYKGAADAPEAFETQLGAVSNEGGYLVRYDANWQPLAGNGEEAFSMHIRLSEEGVVGEAEIAVFKESSQAEAHVETLYALTAKKLL